MLMIVQLVPNGWVVLDVNYRVFLGEWTNFSQGVKLSPHHVVHPVNTD